VTTSLKLAAEPRARERAATALKLAPSADFIDPAAIALARCGDLGRAESIAGDLGKRDPLDTIINAVTLPVIRVTAQITRQQPARAIELLRTAEPYELRDFAVPYTRGLAYLSAGMGRKAAAEFQKIPHNPGVDPVSPYYPLAHVGLARAYALQSDKVSSRREYSEFFTRWNDADRDIPILRAAQREFAGLNWEPKLPVGLDRLRYFFPLGQQAGQIGAAGIQQIADAHCLLRAFEICQRLLIIGNLHFEARDLVFDGSPPLFHLAQLDGIQAFVGGLL
jgi:hypothetical protein